MFPPVNTNCTDCGWYRLILSSGTKWQFISGGNVTIPDCGSIDEAGYSAQAAFFSGDSSVTRYIETVGLDLTTAMYVTCYSNDTRATCFTVLCV